MFFDRGFTTNHERAMFLKKMYDQFPDQIENQKFLQLLIDDQFNQSKVIIHRLAWLYIIFFFIPFVYQIHLDDVWTVRIINLVCLAVQLIFFLYEMMIFKTKGLKLYFRLDQWNKNDFVKFFIYVAYFVVRWF